MPLEVDQIKLVSRLKKEGFIRDENAFSFIAGLIKFPGTIDPGSYMLQRNYFAFTVADILLNHPYQRWVILVPGLRNEQLAERIAKKLNWNSSKINEFMANAKEGYMFPDTYLFNVDWTGKQVALRMVSNFNEKFDAQLQKDLLAQDVKNDTAIKIASIIERESGGPDKALIAGVIWNRLNKKMKLDMDATIQYAVGTKDNWWPNLASKDMKIDSPYNTYIYKGLPPAPICNPSLNSIKAAIYPVETDCLFYLHSPDKQIHCADTYEEHKQNIQKYLN